VRISFTKVQWLLCCFACACCVLFIVVNVPSDVCYYAFTPQRGDEYFPGYVPGIVYRSALPMECSSYS
jgi:hypothetical protein